MYIRFWFPPGLTLWVTEGLVDELGCRVEELGDVEGGFVISLDTIVLDVHVTVVTSTSQHIVPLSLRCIKNMCYTQFPQARPLQSCFPATHRLTVKAPILSLTTCTHTLCAHLLTHPRCRRWARPGWHVHTEPQCRSRTAAPDLMFLVWCNHCLGPPAPLCMGSCFWTSAHRRTWLTCAAHRTHTHIPELNHKRYLRCGSV